MNLNPKQKKALKSAMSRKYGAAAFDIDGTLTDLAKFSMPTSLIHALAHLPGHVPLAICTGRDVAHVQSKITHICDYAPDNHDHRKRWYIFCENGCAGYSYNCKDNSVKMIHSVKWPDNIMNKETLEAFIKDKLGWHVIVNVREFSLVVRFPNLFYLFPAVVRRISRKTAKDLTKILMDLKVDKNFSVQDSGIGSIIIPSEAGKGKAIATWAKQMKMPVSEVLVVGDKANVGENDEEFLSGEFGTAFTVGKLTKNIFPLPVLDQWGKKLSGPEGTEFLLSEVRFK